MEDGTPVTSENDQKLSFRVITDRPAFVVFSEPPTLTADGNLSFTLLPGVTGVVPIRVTLADDGGTADYGVDTSYEYILTMNVVADADAPRLIELTTDGVTVLENADRTYFPGLVMAARGVFADYTKKFTMVSTPNPKPYTLHLKSQTPNPQTQTLNPKPQIPNSKPSIPNPISSTLTPKR